ncbi:cobalt-precorrin 5A hydrolase [Pseudomonas hunanensis]|uniref:Cobalt-precorrin 5A hydrolase n=1 Tax=Pseudomonas hunanensis TaxID=1247546 RepID=A0ACC6K1V2_9PSED|nr:cobalt-precorrin 5A hydrolase [Pseudomonas hunanensis]
MAVPSRPPGLMHCAPALPALYAGFGCRRGCPVDVLETLLRQSLATLQLPLSALRGFASIDLKADEAGLLTLANRLAQPLVLFSATQLLTFEGQLSHRSLAAFNHSGCWGVAESTALALATQAHGAAHLVLPRQTCTQATLALACGR